MYQLDDWAQDEIVRLKNKEYKRGLCTLNEFIQMSMDVIARSSESDSEFCYLVSEFFQLFFPE